MKRYGRAPTPLRPAAPPAWRTRGWAITGALSVTETVSWGVLYYAFAVFLLPMQRALDASAAQVTGALSLALFISALAGMESVITWTGTARGP